MQTLIFPSDLSNSEEITNRVVVFMAIEGQSTKHKPSEWYKGGKDVIENAKNFYKTAKSQCVIILPMPNAIVDTQGHTWSQSNFIDALLDTSDSVKNIAEQMGLVGKIASTPLGIANATARFGAYAGKSKISGAMSTFMGARKPMMRPGYFQNYEDSSLRQFSCEYTFMPNNKKESLEMLKIIQAFKRYSSPQSTNSSEHTLSNFFSPLTDKVNSSLQNNMASKVTNFFDDMTLGNVMLSPFIWNITFGNATINSMFQFNTVALQSISVEYANNGKIELFEDGIPKCINMSLTFTEMDLKYANSYNDNIENILSNKSAYGQLRAVMNNQQKVEAETTLDIGETIDRAISVGDKYIKKVANTYDAVTDKGLLMGQE